MTNAEKLKASWDSEDMVTIIRSGVLDIDECKCCIQTEDNCSGRCDWAIRKWLEAEENEQTGIKS